MIPTLQLGQAGRAIAPIGETVLLLHFNSTNGATVFSDSSRFGHTVTPSGAAQHSTADFQFGPSSALFAGSPDRLTIPSSAAFDLGDTYTVEFWIKPTSIAGNFGVLHRGFYDSGFQTWTGLQFSIRHLGAWAGDPVDRCRFYFYATTFATEQYIDVIDGFSPSEWRHVAMVRQGTVGKVYVKGVLSGTITGLLLPAATSTQTLRIGAWDFSANTEFFPGRLDEVRITKGAARYVANFTPPAAAFTS